MCLTHKVHRITKDYELDREKQKAMMRWSQDSIRQGVIHAAEFMACGAGRRERRVLREGYNFRVGYGHVLCIQDLVGFLVLLWHLKVAVKEQGRTFQLF